MTLRQAKYRKNRLAGMNAYRAAIQAGYTHETAKRAYENIEKRIPLKDLFLKNGLDDHTVIKVLGDGLNANRAISKDKMISDDNGNPQKITEIVEIPDHAVRHKFLETFMKVRGNLKQESAENQRPILMMPVIMVGDQPLEYKIGSPDEPRSIDPPKHS